MKSRIPKAMPQHVKPKRDGMDAKHLDNVRGLPCIACGWMRHVMHAHHLLRAEGRGLSRKTADKWAVPLCPACHVLLHAAGDEEAWLTERGIDGRAVASALWAVRGDPEGMQRIVMRWRQTAAALAMRTNA